MQVLYYETNLCLFLQLQCCLMSNLELKPHDCKLCGKQFSLGKLLDFHSVVHDHCQLECDYCGKKFKSKSNLKNHFVSHNKPRPLRGKRLQCKSCDKYFASKQSLLRHLKQHERIKV